MKRIILLIALAAHLQGCVFIVGAAAGAATIAIVYDHRSITTTLEDTKIANKINDRIHANQELAKNSHIEVSVFNRIVLLTGETPTPEWKQAAEEAARSVPNVTRVYNQLSIEGTTSPLTRTSDSWITTKVKSLMLADENLKSSSVKVVTENGVVYLLGQVSERQGRIAVEIARRVTGVQKVVKIFQYVK